MTTKTASDQQTHTYRVLIDIAEEVVGNARAGLERTRTMRGKNMFTDMAIEELRGQIEHFCGLGDRVIDQARRRVLFGEQVATDEKILFPSSSPSPTSSSAARCARRSSSATKSSSPSAEGLITQYEVLKGNPPDEESGGHLPLRRHQRSVWPRLQALYRLGSRLLQ